tara:strand:+ start:519 stop:1013 length:495 start_codon:yes stop_codon:yes gene_type:complete
MSILKVDTINEKTSGNGVRIPGHVVQVQRTYVASASEISTTSTSLAASGIQCSITPKFNNSLITVDFTCTMAEAFAGSQSMEGRMYLKIGSASIAQMTGAGAYHLYYMANAYDVYQPIAFSGSYTATSTDTLMFEPYFKSSGGGTMKLAHTASSYALTAMEIAQ